jgi:hypothetical protein
VCTRGGEEGQRCRTRISRRKESVGERFVGGREMVATRRTTVRDGDGGETCGSLEARLRTSSQMRRIQSRSWSSPIGG